MNMKRRPKLCRNSTSNISKQSCFNPVSFSTCVNAKELSVSQQFGYSPSPLVRVFCEFFQRPWAEFGGRLNFEDVKSSNLQCSKTNVYPKF